MLAWCTGILNGISNPLNFEFLVKQRTMNDRQDPDFSATKPSAEPESRQATPADMDEVLYDNLKKKQGSARMESAQSAIESVVNASNASTGHKPGWERDVLERLAFATLSEQKTARRWRNFIRLAWLGFFLLLVWIVFFMPESSTTTSPSTEHTAMVQINGEIMQGAEASAEAIIPAIRQALEDKGSKALVLLINSPGGSPVQAGMISDEIKRLKAKHNKPVYAVVEEMCASAAYYIASSADEIYVDKASIVGSIGVLMDSFGFTGLMDKLGVERRLMTAGENKGFLDPFSPQTDQQKQFAQSMLDTVHQQFIATVKEGRGKKLKDSPELFSGLFWTGQQSIEMGLADKLGSLDFVAREVVKAEDLVDYTQRENVAERLAKRFGASIGEGAMRALKSVPQMR
jgi:protease IV